MVSMVHMQVELDDDIFLHYGKLYIIRHTVYCNLYKNLFTYLDVLNIFSGYSTQVKVTFLTRSCVICVLYTPTMCQVMWTKTWGLKNVCLYVVARTQAKNTRSITFALTLYFMHEKVFWKICRHFGRPPSCLDYWILCFYICDYILLLNFKSWPCILVKMRPTHIPDRNLYIYFCFCSGINFTVIYFIFSCLKSWNSLLKIRGNINLKAGVKGAN